MGLKALYHRSLCIILPKTSQTPMTSRIPAQATKPVPVQPTVEAPLADSSNEYTGAGGAFGHRPIDEGAGHRPKGHRPTPPAPRSQGNLVRRGRP